MVAGKAAESFHYISVMAARVKWKKEGKRVPSRTRGTPEEYKRTPDEKPRVSDNFHLFTLTPTVNCIFLVVRS